MPFESVLAYQVVRIGSTLWGRELSGEEDVGDPAQSGLIRLPAGRAVTQNARQKMLLFKLSTGTLRCVMAMIRCMLGAIMPFCLLFRLFRPMAMFSATTCVRESLLLFVLLLSCAARSPVSPSKPPSSFQPVEQQELASLETNYRFNRISNPPPGHLCWMWRLHHGMWPRMSSPRTLHVLLWMWRMLP